MWHALMILLVPLGLCGMSACQCACVISTWMINCYIHRYAAFLLSVELTQAHPNYVLCMMSSVLRTHDYEMTG